SIPLLFALGRRFYGAKAGLIAAACLAVSPSHIWLAQGVRPNALMELLVVVSMYAVARGCSERHRGWLALAGAANFGLAWSYFFGLLFIMAEFVYVALFWFDGGADLKKWRRTTLAWWAANTTICLSPYLWLRSHMEQVHSAADDFFMRLPSPREALFTFFGYDAAMTTEPFLYQGQTWEFLGQRIGQDLLQLHGFFDWAVVLFSVSATAGVIAFLTYSLLSERRREAFLARREALFPLFVLFVPMAAMLTLSLLWRPCILPRYSSYCSFSLYMFIGWLIARATPKPARFLLALALAMTYAYQISVSLPATTRTDWRSAARLLQQRAAPGDLILLRGMILSDQMLGLYGGLPAPVLLVPSYRSACERIARHLEANPDQNAWVLLEDFVYRFPPANEFERALHAMNLAWNREDIAGMNGIRAYEITRMPGKAIGSPTAIAAETDYEAVLRTLALDISDGAARESVLTALNRAIDMPFYPGPFHLMKLSLFLTAEGHPDLGEAVARTCLRIRERYVMGWLALAIALGTQNRLEEMTAAFEQMHAFDATGLSRAYEAAALALFKHHDTAEGQKRLDEMAGTGFFVPTALSRAAGNLP
ncbi:MAG TPA: hypothetical protein ENN29_00390, partial [Candidatus Hydrogenedentes bacterium]|nr:hypothetical protein [Candidatus Hydrogenedentota bacterium]